MYRYRGEALLVPILSPRLCTQRPIARSLCRLPGSRQSRDSQKDPARQTSTRLCSSTFPIVFPRGEVRYSPTSQCTASKLRCDGGTPCSCCQRRNLDCDISRVTQPESTDTTTGVRDLVQLTSCLGLTPSRGLSNRTS